MFSPEDSIIARNVEEKRYTTMVESRIVSTVYSLHFREQVNPSCVDSSNWHWTSGCPATGFSVSP
jgi:hypothetical protein